MEKLVITPKVDDIQEFIEIALDFSNPLDLVREGISNSFDAGATKMKIAFKVINDCGEKVLSIELYDNGHGMNREGLQSFFDLGNSMRRDNKDAIGEKGHGTKVYFNSKCITVESVNGGYKYVAVMNEPNRKLHNREIPTVDLKVERAKPNQANYTKIVILGYNNNRRNSFTHANLKDYILWFTKMGSIEKEFGIYSFNNIVLDLKGVDSDQFETIKFGHYFPNESKKVSELFDEFLVEAPKRYCKRIIKTGTLKNSPEVTYSAVFYIEGIKVKYDYNPMIRRSGYNAPSGAYTVQERYGLWLCKDFIPVQRKNEWITQKGSEYTKFHAFVNCQDLRMTANRGSIENTSLEILQDLKEVVTEIYTNIIQSPDWKDISWLESEVDAYNTSAKEKKDFEWRIDKINRAKVARFQDINLIEPQRESGVFSIYMQLSSINSNIFPFQVVDYDTHSGIDVIVKANDNMPIKTSKLYYVEFKNYLEKSFNHSFNNLYSIICWDINLKEIKHGEEVVDIANERRILKIIPPANANDYTRYYLDSVRSARKIEVFVLKYYLKEKYNIEFVPRTEKECY